MDNPFKRMRFSSNYGNGYDRGGRSGYSSFQNDARIDDGGYKSNYGGSNGGSSGGWP